MVVVLLLVGIWAAVLVPPAVRAHNARREAFEVGFGRLPSPGSAPAPAPAASPRHSPPVQRRRRIAGGLLAAMVVTGLAGLLPTFRVLLVVHLFVVDSFLFYLALLARRADRYARAAGNGGAPFEAPHPAPAVPLRRRTGPRQTLLVDLPPVTSAR